MSNETPTNALRLVPRRAVYDWIRDDVPLNVKLTITPQHVDALLSRLSKAAPASPLPEGGGWKPSRNDVARRCDPKAWEFYDRHIDNPIMGAECRAEVAASIRMADAILALPAAPTGAK